VPGCIAGRAPRTGGTHGRAQLLCLQHGRAPQCTVVQPSVLLLLVIRGFAGALLFLEIASEVFLSVKTFLLKVRQSTL